MDRSLRAAWFHVTAASVLLACAGAPRAPEPKAAQRGGSTPKPLEAPDAERYSWESPTSSPQPLAGATTGTACGASDRALSRVAERLAAREAAGKPLLDTSEITFAIRSAGAPYVWPRAWTLHGEHGDETRRAKVEEWLGTLSSDGERRCAVASQRTSDGAEAFAAVAVSVLADLRPLPTRVSVGTWLDFEAVLLVPATGVEVIVLGPRGRPHAVLASLHGANVRARFRADHAGPWLVQVLATTANGSRLAAEALVAAGEAPPETFDAGEAPGERSVASGANPRDALFEMLNAARASEGLGSVRRDARLDRLADAQAEAMREAKALSHDLGGASLVERVSALSLRSAGENAAHAMDPARAHRSLWKSPSHRETLLYAGFELVGIGVAKDDDGSVWVTEIFADQ